MAISALTHWGRVTHICVVTLTIIGSDNGLSPGRRQAIIWTRNRILLIGLLWTNFIEILIGIHTFSFNKRHLKMSSTQWRPFCLGLNVLTHPGRCGSNLQKHVTDYVHEHLLNFSQVNVTEHLWWQVSIGSGNGLVPSGNKPLSEPMFTLTLVTICHH